jgi:hypothetical protein
LSTFADSPALVKLYAATEVNLAWQDFPPIMVSVTTERKLETLTAEDFRLHQGTKFRMTAEKRESGPADHSEVELTDISEYPPAPPGASRAPFSVVFYGPLEPVLPQGIYRLEHEHFGTLELFVVPIGPNKVAPGQTPTAMRYEAVFG